MKEKSAQYDALKKVMLDEENDKTKSASDNQNRALESRNSAIEKEMQLQ